MHTIVFGYVNAIVQLMLFAIAYSDAGVGARQITLALERRSESASHMQFGGLGQGLGVFCGALECLDGFAGL